MNILVRAAVAATFTLGTGVCVAQSATVPDGTKLGDWITLDNKASFSKLQKEYANSEQGATALAPGAVVVPLQPSARAPVPPSAVTPKERPPVTTALYGMTSREGDQFRGLLQWGDRVYAVRVGGYVRVWKVKKISELGTTLVNSHGRELFAPLDVDSGEAATPVPRPQVVQAPMLQAFPQAALAQPAAISPIPVGQTAPVTAGTFTAPNR